jgi:hypothetical protein
MCTSSTKVQINVILLLYKHLSEDALAEPVRIFGLCDRTSMLISVVDSSKSSTFQDVSTGFRVKYGDQSGATGDFITDNFGIGGVTIQNLTMGLATKTTTGSGLMGIGYDTLEAGYQAGDLKQPYKSIIDTMLVQGLINTKSYSLYLDDLTAKSGSIIFGGADTQKFMYVRYTSTQIMKLTSLVAL